MWCLTRLIARSRGSESKDEDMGADVDAADAIREAFDCAVIIVHHCGVDGSRPRGHTSLGGAVDVELAVTRTDDKITVKVEWMKDGPEGDVICGQIECIALGVDEDGDAFDSRVVVPLDPPATESPKKQLPQIPRAALRFLWECVAEGGRAAPPSSRIPGQAKGVTLDEWKSHLLKAGVINEKGNPREQFKRIHVTLQNVDRCLGGFCMACHIASHGRHILTCDGVLSHVTSRHTPYKGVTDVTVGLPSPSEVLQKML